MAYYWYQSDPQLYQMEVAAMKKFFPSFTINQLQDGSGRLYWRGKVQPTGQGGMVWDLMLFIIIRIRRQKVMAVQFRFFRFHLDSKMWQKK